MSRRTFTAPLNPDYQPENATHAYVTTGYDRLGGFHLHIQVDDDTNEDPEDNSLYFNLSDPAAQRGMLTDDQISERLAAYLRTWPDTLMEDLRGDAVRGGNIMHDYGRLN